MPAAKPPENAPHPPGDPPPPRLKGQIPRPSNPNPPQVLGKIKAPDPPRPKPPGGIKPPKKPAVKPKDIPPPIPPEGGLIAIGELPE